MQRLQTTDAIHWRGLYKIGGISALFIAILMIGETVVYALFPRPASIAEHFKLFQENKLIGLLTLDLLGMISYLLFIPLILSLYIILRRNNAAFSLIATVLFFVGIADFYATNTAFSVLDLSNQYAVAKTEAEKAILLAAGQAMFTQFNENAFLVSYALVSAAWLMISVVMISSKLFGKISAYAGMLAGASGIVAVILEHVSSAKLVLNVAIGFYFAAIIFLLVWVALVGRQLYRIGEINKMH